MAETVTKLPQPITESELRRRLMDPDTPDDQIAPYLMVDPRGSTGFAPSIVPNPAVVLPSAEEGAVLMASANGIEKWRRHMRYRQKLKTWTGPRLVSEGDSWFQYPFLLEDVIDHLGAHYAIRSLGGAGDLVADIVAQDELIATIAAERPDGVLLSGGGNDLLGEGRLVRSLHPYAPGRAVEDYLTPGFEVALADILALYRGLLGRVVAGFPGLPVLIHGYDHAIPARGKWLGRPMQSLGILDPVLQRALVALMVDRFYAGLSALVADPGLRGQVTLIDCRSVVHEWHDELHPTDAGYGKVAARFHAALQLRLVPRENALESMAAAPITGLPAGLPAGLAAAAEAATAMQTLSDAQLEAEIGRRLLLSGADPDRPLPMLAEARPLFDDALEGTNGFRSIGQRLLKRLNREMHALLCGDAAEDAGDRKALRDALGLGDAAVAGVLVKLLVTGFGLSPAVAAVVAAALLRHVLQPTMDELCKIWGDSLDPTPEVTT